MQYKFFLLFPVSSQQLFESLEPAEEEQQKRETKQRKAKAKAGEEIPTIPEIGDEEEDEAPKAKKKGKGKKGTKLCFENISESTIQLKFELVILGPLRANVSTLKAFFNNVSTFKN